MTIIVFEDEHAARLRPITLSRPAYAISCGSFRLVDWLRQLNQPLHGIVQGHLTELQAVDFPDLARAPDARSSPPFLLVNARLVPSRAAFDALGGLLRDGRAGVVRTEDEIAAAVLTRITDVQAIDWRAETAAVHFRQLGLDRLETLPSSLPLFRFPHDVVRHNMSILGDNLEHRLVTGRYRELRDGLFAAGSVTIGEYVVSDTSRGPILLEEGVSIGPFCLLRGPAHIGRSAKLIEHAAIKDAVSVGHTTKIGGEVEASVIEPYTNKQHHGFLGHSYLGSWINLGAGTCNSDLKNTYGSVNMEYPTQRVPTGMQFVGCMMGDYAKSAINTGIFTGKVIGVCSMLYGFVTTNVPSFVNYARLFGQVTELPADVMIATQERMFRRRNVEQRLCDAQLIRDMYELTRTERQLAGEPLSL
jgi:glucose-1-phosphate thymidylyltransferase